MRGVGSRVRSTCWGWRVGEGRLVCSPLEARHSISPAARTARWSSGSNVVAASLRPANERLRLDESVASRLGGASSRRAVVCGGWTGCGGECVSRAWMHGLAADGSCAEEGMQWLIRTVCERTLRNTNHERRTLPARWTGRPSIDQSHTPTTTCGIPTHQHTPGVRRKEGSILFRDWCVLVCWCVGGANGHPAASLTH